jgi:hypothetical protein
MLGPAGRARRPPYDGAVHWLDRAAARALSRLPERQRVFRDGWGEPDDIDWYRSVAGTVPDIPDVPIRLRPARRSGGRVVRDLEFDSPIERLPERSRRVRARMVAPLPDPERVMVLFTAWNDEDYRTRNAVAELLCERGIAGVILQQPLYGQRRREPGNGPPITRVSDFGLMGRAAVVEGNIVGDWLRRRGHTVGVGGFSMGGQLASFSAATLPFPVAAAPVSGAYSPAVPFLDGIMRATIAWEALGDGEVEERLRSYLLEASVLRFPPPAETGASVIVAGTKDGFVPTASVLAVHRHWPGSVMEWVNAGHGTMLWRRKDRMVAAAETAFDGLEEALRAG